MQGTFCRYGTLIISRQRSDESRVGGAADRDSSGFCNEVVPRGGATTVSSMAADLDARQPIWRRGHSKDCECSIAEIGSCLGIGLGIRYADN